MISRRKFAAGTAVALAAPALVPTLSNPAHSLEIDEDGMHVQEWFRQSFLELGDEQAQVNGQNKHLAVFFEQRGCPYCREMHQVNLQIPEIVEFIKSNFGVLQINLWGSKIVTDFDGTEFEEKEFARKWLVNFTPTVIFLRQGDLTGIPIQLAEAARMPGYLKPFHFISMFEFVAGKHYEEKTFQRFLQNKFDRYKAEGKKPEIW